MENLFCAKNAWPGEKKILPGPALPAARHCRARQCLRPGKKKYCRARRCRRPVTAGPGSACGPAKKKSAGPGVAGGPSLPGPAVPAARHTGRRFGPGACGPAPGVTTLLESLKTWKLVSQKFVRKFEYRKIRYFRTQCRKIRYSFAMAGYMGMELELL
jgi:hypothetical protein